MLADMAMHVHASRLMVHHVAQLVDRGQVSTVLEASMAKCVAADTAMKVTTVAVQISGGVGYTREFPVERYMRDARIVQISGGTNRIQRVIMARAARGVVFSAPRGDGSRWSAFALPSGADTPGDQRCLPHSDRSDLLRLAECEIVRT